MDSLADYVFKILGLVAGQEPEANYTDPTTPFVLLNYKPQPYDDEEFVDFLERTSVAVSHLSHELFQAPFLRTPGAVELFLRSFVRVCDSIELDELGGGVGENDDEEDEIRAQVNKVRGIFVQTLADLSAHPEFTAEHPLDGSVATELRSWLASEDPNPHLQSAACLALGNLARGDEPCLALVQGPGGSELVTALSSIVFSPSTQSDAPLLHSALGFLKNLAIPAKNKAVLGASLLQTSSSSTSATTTTTGEMKPKEDAVSRRQQPAQLSDIWSRSVQPQVQFDAVSITRLLLVACPENTLRMLESHSSNSDDNADSNGDTTTTTLLQRLLTSSSAAEQEPTKLEGARAALAISRVLATTTTTAQSEDIDNDSNLSAKLPPFLASHNKLLVPAFILLSQQARFPALVSELWFVLALVARSSPAAADALVGHIFHSNDSPHQSPAQEPKSSKSATTNNDAEEEEEVQADASSSSSSPMANLMAALSQIVLSTTSSSSDGGRGDTSQQQQAQDPPAAAPPNKQRTDRENALVLAHELARHLEQQEQQEEEQKQSVLDALRDLLRQGAPLVAADKEV